MAKLPDDTAFGAIDAGISGRPIASVDTTGFARGAAAMGSAAEKLGEGIEKFGKGVGVYGRAQEAEDEKLDLARAKSDFLTKKVENDQLYKDDKDHDTLVDRYGKDVDTIRANSAGLIRNPRTREFFELSISDDVAKAKAAAGETANKIWKDNTLADGNARLEDIRNAALKSTDPAERAKLISSGNDLISSLSDKNIITRTQAQTSQREWVTKYAAGALSIMPAEQRLDELRGPATGRDAVLDRIGKIENSSGDPAARSSTSSAMGDFQFIDKTWLETVKSKRPDLLQGRTEKQVLDLRSDPKLSREMAGYLLDANAASLQKSGLETTPQNLYLAHFLGPGTAAAVLSAKPGTPVSDVVDAKAIAANTSVLAGKTTDTVINWASRKMGASGTMASLLPEDTRVRMANEAQREVDIGAAHAASAQSEVWERKIIDSTAGIGVLPNRKDIEADPALDEPRRNTLLKQYDSAAGDVVGLQNFLTKLKDPNAGTFNPYDADEKKYADRAYGALGGDLPAMQSIVARTGILPKSAAASIKGDLISNNPDRVASALTVTSNMITNNPNILVGVEGKADIENTSVAFRHYVDDLGMSAQDAAKNIIRDQSPEWQAKVKAKIKAEDIDAKIKKELSIGDLSGAFDQSWIPFNDPKVGFDVRTRTAMFGQYAELVKDAYLDSANGDMTLAKKQAANQLKKTWGVSTINGSSVVMQYPPERAPAYANIPNPAGVIAKQAVLAIRDETRPSQDVILDRNKAFTLPGAKSFNTNLGEDEPKFQQWVATNKVPFDLKAKETDYDMRGYWKALQSGDPKAVSAMNANDGRPHYPDFWKTPLHETFSADSQWAKPDAPRWNDKDQLVTKGGKVLVDERNPGMGDIDRAGIRLMPIPGRTATAYKAGQPVPYDISWTDKNGLVQSLSPGRAFVADPVAMRGDVVAERKAVVEAGQVAADKAGDEKLIGTADRFLSQKQRAAKKALIDSRANADVAAGTGEVGDIASGTMDPTIAATASNAFPSRPAGRMGPAR